MTLFEDLSENDKQEVIKFKKYLAGEITGKEKLEHEGYTEEEIKELMKRKK